MSNQWNPVSKFINFTIKGITPSYVKHSSIIVLNQKCIRNNKIDYSFSQYTDDTKNISSDKFIRKGDILVNSTGAGTAGRCAFVKDIPENYKLIVDSHILILRCNSYYEAQCLNYVLFSFEETLMSFMTGSSGQSELDKVILLGLKTRMTNAPEIQKKIASVLSILDTKIELNNKINTELEAMAKTLYDYWFVQFDFPDENGKPYKSSGGEMVWSEELKREIPKGWEVKFLGDEVKFQRGISYTSSEINNDGIPMINLNSFNLDGTYKPDGIKYYAGKYQQKNIANPGDLLIAATDVTRNADIIGKAILVPDYYKEDLVFSMDIAKVISEKIPSSFLMMLFNSNHYHNYIKWYATGTLVLHLDLDGINRYRTELPPEALLKKFDDLYFQVTSRIFMTREENQKLTDLRDWLLPMLINGQVVVE